MGNNDTRPIRFRQSNNDFPLTVSLGEKAPSWALSRWRGNGGLRFVPHDDEGFILRGDRRRLLYKGRRCSHRFTILCDGAFEYDCILLREPESNLISLRMDGAENFDFYRQPDFVSDPFLKGSYAVYKKETLIGEGTGKLCHIHRPEIIDARGRRCWGELLVVGDELRITIPEKWLGEAAYPVVVDPTIGTTTIGSQTPQNSTLSHRANILYEFAASKFIATEIIAGNCMAYIYTIPQNGKNGPFTPLLFDNVNEKPRYRRSLNEEVMDGIMWYRGPNYEYLVKEAQWRTAGFCVIDSVQEGDTFWFGGYGDPFTPRFDYGGILYKNYPEQVWTREPEEYYDEEEDEWYADEGEFHYLPDFPRDGNEKLYDFLYSWYFTFESQPKNYMRTLIQGVNLTDNRKLSRAIKRTTVQTARVTTVTSGITAFLRYVREHIKAISDKQEEKHFSRVFSDSVNADVGFKRIQDLFRTFADTVSGFDVLDRIETISRKFTETVVNTLTVGRFPLFRRIVNENVGISSSKNENIHFSRKCDDSAGVGLSVKKSMGFFRKVEEILYGMDKQELAVLFYRSIADTTAITQVNRHERGFYRTVISAVENFDGMESGVDFFRCQSDSVYAGLSVFRKLDIFIRLVTGVLVWERFLGRFLKAKAEIVLKSPVTREITLESRISEE